MLRVTVERFELFFESGECLGEGVVCGEEEVFDVGEFTGSVDVLGGVEAHLKLGEGDATGGLEAEAEGLARALGGRLLDEFEGPLLIGGGGFRKSLWN